MATEPLHAEEKIHLILNYRPLGLVRATALALDDEAMTVDTGCILLPPAAEVEVTCAYRQADGSQVHRLKGRIVTARAGFTRLRFEAEDPDTMAFVERLRERLKTRRPVSGLPARYGSDRQPAVVAP